MKPVTRQSLIVVGKSRLGPAPKVVGVLNSPPGEKARVFGDLESKELTPSDGSVRAGLA